MSTNTSTTVTTELDSPPPIIEKFSSLDGQQFIRNLLRPLLPYDPHDYQLQGVCACLDGKDLIALTATGSGKTGYFSMYMLALRALGNNPNLCNPPRKIHRAPAMVVVCPTVGLEEDMVRVSSRPFER